MIDFKAVYDALVTQYEAVQDVAERIEAHFVAEDIDAALALEPELNEAQMKADQIGSLYRRLVNIDADPAKHFVPAAEPQPDADPQNKLTRRAFDALEPVAKANFVAVGGIIQDEE